MSTTIEEFVAELGWEVDDEQLKQFAGVLDKVEDIMKGLGDTAEKAADDVDDFSDDVDKAAESAKQAEKDLKTLKDGFGKAGKGVAIVTTAIVGATAALATWLGLSNRATAVNARQAESVGLTTESYEALTGVTKQLGFEGEKAIDLVEEMNNKMGERKALGPFTSVDESLQMLNLSFEELSKLAPEEQFIKIMDTAKGMQDQQKAVSAVDMMMGGDANKFLGHLRQFDGSLEDITNKYKAMNFLTNEGAEGAKGFDDSLQLLLGSLDSMQSQLAALVGEHLQPLLDALNEWIADNKELIKAKIKDWAQNLAAVLETVWNWAMKVISAFNDFIDVLGGATNAVNLLVVALGMGLVVKLQLLWPAIIKTIALIKGVGLQALLTQAKLLLIPLAVAALGALIFLVLEDLWTFLEGGESVFGKLGETIANFIWDTKESFKAWLGEVWEDVKTTFARIGEWIQEKLSTGVIGAALEFFGVNTGSQGAGAATAAATAPGATAGGLASVNNSTSQQQDFVTVTNDFIINATPGMNAQEVAEIAAKTVRQETAKAARNNTSGVDY